jgi:RNA ligase (TIGR02306 family)
MSRHLASIQKIASVEPIPNADRIEVAAILGWHCVVKKGDFKAGDFCAYFEVDSFLPVKPEFAFLDNCLRHTDFGDGYRIKTIRLRGVISQGLAMPLSILPPGVSVEEGMDVTDVLGVKLYAPPVPAELKGSMKGAFPAFISKTDETRVQVLQDVLARHKGEKCYITEKIDGSSATFYIKDGVFGVCSRNIELLESDTNAFWKLARELDIENKLRALNCDVAIQGELYGNGINCNPLKVPGKEIRFFNAFDIKSFAFYDSDKFFRLMDALKLPVVPLISDSFALIDDIDALVKLSTRKSLINPSAWAEGIVIRTVKETFDLQMAQGFGNGRMSFKVVNPEYLLTSET